MTPLPNGIKERYGLDEEARRMTHLIAGFLRGTLSPEEHRELEHWVEASDHNMQLFEELTDETTSGMTPGQPAPFLSREEILFLTPPKDNQGAPLILYRFVFPAAAALILRLAATPVKKNSGLL